VKLRSVAEVIGEYPFCVGLTLWGLIVGILTVIGPVPSVSLDYLPRPLQIGWGVAMLVSACATALGLALRRHSLLIVRALILFATTFSTYGIAILSQGGWNRGGGTASLMLIYSVVCVFRSRHLLQHFTALYDNPPRSPTSSNGGGEGT